MSKTLHPVWEATECGTCGEDIATRVETENGRGTYVCNDGHVNSVSATDDYGVTGRQILASAAGSSEYATLSGMSTEDLSILVNHVTPSRARIVRLILAERWPHSAHARRVASEDMSDHESADSYRYDRYNAGM